MKKWLFPSGLVIFSVLAALLMNLSWGEFPSDAEVGSIAKQDIRAEKDYDIRDEEATEKLRQEALDSALPVFDWDEEIGREKIALNQDSLAPWKEKGIQIRRIRHPDEPKILFKDFDSILNLDQAKARIRKPSRREAVRPTLFFNESETALERDEAVSKVQPVIIRVQAGESILRSGDRFEPRHLKLINGIRKEKAKVFGRTRLVGTFFFVGLFLAVLFFALQKSARRIRMQGRDFIFLGLLLLTLMVLERMVVFVGDAIRGLLPLEIPLAAFYGFVPIAAGTMMVRWVLPLSMAVLFAPVAAILAGIVLQGNLTYTVMHLAGSILVIPLMLQVRSRGQILKVGLQLGLLNALALLAMDMVSVTSLSGILSFREACFRIGMAFLGGPFSSVTVLILMPVFESLFNYLTPIKLLEFGSLNHPILREMIVRAPGTYHHSHMVGTLAEAACEAIGADSLFARVASYFHDIGKLKKSQYFIENQSASGGEDRHSHLQASMSALIISSHVKDGIDLAREHKLPERIIDIIPQHQGTKLISYFYSKAKESENPDLHVIDERDYRYPGPKPQTREAGVILLADTVEAATRALQDRSPARLEEVVRNMTNKNFIDGQLDECELTLKDLHIIAKSFIRILMGIYHQRVQYPADAADLEVQSAREGAPGEPLADKYLQSKPISETTLREPPKDPPKNIRRIGG